MNVTRGLSEKGFGIFFSQLKNDKRGVINYEVEHYDSLLMFV